MSDSLEGRFREKFTAMPNGCWDWTANVVRGYGQFKVDGRGKRAPRVAYEMWVGPIPDGLHIDHLCENPLCVNPDHLEPVTCEVNLKRGATTQARINSEKTHCPHGHPYAGANLRVSPQGSRYCLVCKRAKTAAWREKQKEAACVG